MVRKVVVLLLLSVILALLVAACGSEAEESSTEDSEQLTRLGRTATPVFGSSYVSPLTEIFGDVYMGQESFISASTVLRAAPDLWVEIGNQSTIHDNAVVRAREDSLTIGDQTALAHHSIVHDSQIGNS